MLDRKPDEDNAPATRVSVAATLVRQSLGNQTARIPELFELNALAERFRAAATNDQWVGFSPRDWRMASHVLWLDTPYLAEHPRMLREIQQRADRIPVLRRLIASYLRAFDPTLSSIQEVGQWLKNRLHSAAENTPVALWRDRGERYRLFDVAEAPQHLAVAMLSGELQTLDEVGISSEIQAVGLATVAFSKATKLLLTPQEGDRAKMALRLMKWAAGDNGIRYPAQISGLADALLLSWGDSGPDEQVREAVKKFLLDHLGDPRTRLAEWKSVRLEAKRCLLQWLAGDTLRQVFDVFDTNPDQHHLWVARRDFWMGYYDAGYIQDAWVVLSPRDETRVRNMVGSGFSAGRLHGYSSRSVLLMNVGGVVISEKIPGGRCHAWEENSPSAPSLYEAVYDYDRLEGGVLREAMRGGVVHRGGWQVKVANFIGQRTNIWL